jgi:hypothetical protein
METSQCFPPLFQNRVMRIVQTAVFVVFSGKARDVLEQTLPLCLELGCHAGSRDMGVEIADFARCVLESSDQMVGTHGRAQHFPHLAVLIQSFLQFRILDILEVG